LTKSTRQTSAHDNNIDSAIKCLRAVPGTQLNSQLNSADTRPVPNRRTPRQRNTTLTQSDYNTLNGTHYFAYTLRNRRQPSSRSIKNCSAPRQLHPHAEISAQLHSTSLNSIIIITAKINTYSLAPTFPLYRDISINSSDVGHFKLAHPMTLQIFIRLFKYA